MNDFIAYLRDFNFVTSLIRMVLALLLGGVIGIERERHGHAAGFRTHILVCIGSAMTILVGLYAVDVLSIDTDPLRIGAQVVSGIGFLGVGTILITGKRHVKGLTTAAGLWSTAAIGLAVGIGFYEGAICCTALLCLVMSSLKNLDVFLSRKYISMSIYFEATDGRALGTILEQIKAMGIRFEQIGISPSKSNEGIGVEATLRGIEHRDKSAVLSQINQIDNVLFVIELI